VCVCVCVKSTERRNYGLPHILGMLVFWLLISPLKVVKISKAGGRKTKEWQW
jgi:hypothetical protein